MTDLSRWHTWREIHAQPAIWAGWAQGLDIAGLRGWIAGLDVDEVWFCGAGTSAYIGEIIAAGMERAPGPCLRAVATTDIVSRPQTYLTGRRPLVVSFGRSGNSTESIGTLDALDALAPDAPRLAITCNPTGTLATRLRGIDRAVVLPEATHDAGFAMTSSFSTMLLTALALFDPVPDAPARMAALAAQLRALLPGLARFATGPLPERVVFVGAGPLAFAARESALKVMELTAGQIPALWDSTLGFRHGPKSFVRGDTAIFVLTAPDPHAARYDADLVAELRAQFPAARVTAVGPGGDIAIAMPFGATWGAPLAVALAQVLAVMWSDRLGLDADSPFEGQGTLSRVVAGVTLYPVAP
ncbi:MAG: SIS domain-containing protein [Rhodobacterales bacterium]|nr:SIS domain-containing protein [Rhodobacterales bacterium]NCT11800.1 SIS domain-containing protein [Rhodobacterales bacterium]